jgi:uncharacterized repeat protein (TIGR01451 family)
LKLHKTYAFRAVVLIGLLWLSVVSQGGPAPLASAASEDVREPLAVCRELPTVLCSLGWILPLQEESSARADVDLWHMTGRILSYSDSGTSWNSRDAVFLGCHKPTVNTDSRIFEHTIYLQCTDAVYAIRRFDAEHAYTCLRFSFADNPQELLWACYEDRLALGPMVDLSIRSGASPEAVAAGGTWTWTLTVQNDAIFQANADDAVVTAVLPGSTRISSVTASQGSCQSTLTDAWTIVCSLGALPSSGIVTVEMSMTLDPVFPATWIQATATVSDRGRTFDPVSANNFTSTTASVESETFLISPLCIAPEDSITLGGLTIDLAALGPDDVLIEEKTAKILAAGTSGLVVQVPQLPDGTLATVTVRGVSGSGQVTVNAGCAVRALSTEDVQAGFIAGEVLIFLQEGLRPDELEQFRADYGFQSLIEYPLSGFYRAVLGDMPLSRPREPEPVLCQISKRDSAPAVDVLLLLDRSGSMDESRLKPLMRELSQQMYCLLSRNSRVAVMTYSDEVRLELPFAAWSAASYDSLISWIETPQRPQSTSHLEQALAAALDAFPAAAQTEPSKHLLVITRGPALPPMKDIQTLIERAQDKEITVHGLGFLSLFFPSGSYRELRSLAQATGRDITFWEEQKRWMLPEVIAQALVWGVYGITDCSDDCLDRIPSVSATRFEQTADLVERLNRDPRVDQAFTNDLVDTSQGDPYLADQGWLLKLGLPEGWDDFFPHRGAGITLAVIDTGADLRLSASTATAPELVLSALAPEGLNFAPVPIELKHPLGQDELGHGTAVSTIAAASLGNGVNGAGVAPQAILLPIKVFAVVEGQVKASNEAVAQALGSAFSLGVDVINMSLGCRACSASTESALRKYYEKLLNSLLQKQKASPSRAKVPVIVAASGNDGEALIDSPAAHPFVFAVGSVRPDSSGRSEFSNYGPELDFVAIGEKTQTTVVGGQFHDPGSGTSFAAPQVAGLVALILAEEPGLSPDEVKARIIACFTLDVGRPGYDEETGWGRIWIPPLAQAKPECRNTR